jgi:hypothetical protein
MNIERSVRLIAGRRGFQTRRYGSPRRTKRARQGGCVRF